MIYVPGRCTGLRPAPSPQGTAHTNEINHRRPSPKVYKAKMVHGLNHGAAKHSLVELHALAQIINSQHDMIDSVD